MEVGRTDTHVVLRAGPWTAWLAIQEGRFPHVDQVIPAAGSAATRLRLDPADAAFLADALGRLPGGDFTNAPVTVDCNGVVAVRARGEGEDRPTELVLARSGYAWAPARLCVNRDFLARALRLGLGEPEIGGPEDPVAGRGGGRVYAFQPLPRDGAIGPTEDALRIESGPAPPPVPATGAGGPTKARTPVSERPSRPRPEHPGNGPADTPAGGASLAPLIQEAVALHDSLGAARAGGAAHRRPEARAEAVPPALQHPGAAPRPEAPGGRRVGGPAGPGRRQAPVPHVPGIQPEEPRCP